MPKRRLAFFAFAAVGVFCVLSACGGDDDSQGTSTSTATASSGSPAGSATITTAPTPGGDPFVPPLEGQATAGLVTEMTDWREEPDWRMPDPGDITQADDPDNPVLNPPEVPSCPAEWVVLNRPSEGFKICYPVSWVIGSHGFVSSANESRWYALGLYDFSDPENKIQRAHVSVYAFPKFSRPVRYALDCPDLLSVTLSGEPALICQDFPGVNPEANIVSYHVFREDFDYFLNIVSYYKYDAESETYTDDLEEDALAVAIQVAQTFEFTPVARLATDPPTEVPTDTPGS